MPWPCPNDYDDLPSLAEQDRSDWPFSELIRESPFELHRREAAAAGDFADSRTLPPRATETPVGLGLAVSPDNVGNFSAFAASKL